MKKLLVLFLFSIIILSCNNDFEIFYFEINPTKAEVCTSEQLAIKASVSFSGKDSIDMKWESSNPDIATVDNFGLVTAKNIGKTTISVKCGDLIKECNLTVKKNDRLEK